MVFIIFYYHSIFLVILFPKDWTNAHFFTIDGPNHLALLYLLISSSLSSLYLYFSFGRMGYST